MLRCVDPYVYGTRDAIMPFELDVFDHAGREAVALLVRDAAL